jgi:hypothetical protein
LKYLINLIDSAKYINMFDSRVLNAFE